MNARVEGRGGLAAAAGSALALLLSGCALEAQVPGEPAVKLTWEHAYVMLPLAEGRRVTGTLSGESVREALAALPSGRKFRAVIFLHGCSGMGAGNLDYMRLLADEGFAVVAPDSFARPGRPLTCNPALQRSIPGAPLREVFAMRQEEIRYARGRVRGLSWVDQRNVFLMGHSQGGAAVSAFPEEGFNGVIVSGTICFLGLRVPAPVPVLVVYSENDPWFRGRSARGCEERAARAGRTIEFHLFEGSAHSLALNERARGLIRAFLERHTLSSAPKEKEGRTP